MGNGSLGVQREQTLILHKPNRLHFNILQNSRSNDSLINNLQNLAKELHARNDSTTLIEISFDPKVAYADFIAVIDNFQINHFDFGRINGHYYFYHLLPDTTKTVYPL